MTLLSDTTTFSLSTLNPFLYRSYLYDSETGLYYLQSRYYDPEIGRFINADEPIILNFSGNSVECNLFSYCENDPINNCDYTGMLSVKAIIRFVKKAGLKAWKLIKNVWKAFCKPGKIKLKPFESVIDFVVGLLVPALSGALKALTYKAVNKKLVEDAFKKSGKSFINTLSKFGIKISLNSLFSAMVNDLIFENISRLLTVGGIICLILDATDGSVDYWFNYGELF